jgi:hypothetical protein
MYRSSWLSVINKLMQKTRLRVDPAHRIRPINCWSSARPNGSPAPGQPLTAPVLTQIPHRATHRIPGYQAVYGMDTAPRSAILPSERAFVGRAGLEPATGGL